MVSDRGLMFKLPSISGAEAVKAFGKFGFYFDRQQGTSHAILKKENYPLILSVPQHRVIKKGLLRGLIRDAGLTVEEFCGAL
jgi:predicted RNA binding protein YcfA (HicA-like mRNA interferase family)